MAGFNVEMRGFGEARQNVQSLVDRMTAENQIEAMQPGAKILQGSAAARAPIGAGSPTRGGRHLKHAIETEVRDDRADKVKIAIGPAEEQFHGVFWELGTIDMPAEPFLRPAADADGSKAIRAVLRRLKGEVVKTATRLFKRSALLKSRRRVGGGSRSGKKIRGGEPVIGGGFLEPAGSPTDTF